MQNLKLHIHATSWHTDTPDFEGRGETVPVPYFFQNLAEAEYVVTLYQYMRLLGYPAEKISMLTTYNGQKALLKDVVERRCAHHPAFGVPHKVPLRQLHTHLDIPGLQNALLSKHVHLGSS